jgi:hypothetical protein
MVFVTGCSNSNSTDSKKILNALDEKYEETFTIIAIGDRLGTDTITAYCQSSDEYNTVFEAKVKDDGTNLTDNYIPRKLSSRVEKIIVNIFGQKNVSVAAKVDINGVDYNSITNSNQKLSSFISDFSPSSFTADLVFKDGFVSQSDATQIIESSFKEIYSEIGNTKFATELNFVKDSEFSKLRENMKKAPSVSSGWFGDYEITNSLLLSIDNNILSLTTTELDNKLDK